MTSPWRGQIGTQSTSEMIRLGLIVVMTCLFCLFGYLPASDMEQSESNNCKTKLKILQWNCRSLNINLHYLIQYINQSCCHVICLQSINCLSKKLPKIEGYHYPPITEKTSRAEEKIYTATYIKVEIIHEIYSSPIPVHIAQPIYSNAVQVLFQTKKIKI